MQFFQLNGWHIAQYHPPGGQASFGLIVLGEIVYLDLIACKDSKIAVMENKGRFSKKDIKKLRKIVSDPNAKNQIINYVSESCYINKIGTPIELSITFAHGFSGRIDFNQLQDINLVHVDADGDVRVLQSIENPLFIEEGIINGQ